MARTYGLQCNGTETAPLLFFYQSILRREFATSLVSIINPTIVCFGLILNICLLIVILKTPGMRTITNAYLCCLAISDMIYLAFVGSFDFTAWWLSPFDGDVGFARKPGCILITLVTNVTFFCLMLIVTMVSFDRYMAICHPLEHRKISGKKRTTYQLLACFVAAVALAIPVVYSESYFDYFCWKNLELFKNVPAVYGQCRAPKGKIDFARHTKVYAQVIPFATCFIGECVMKGTCMLFSRRM